MVVDPPNTLKGDHSKGENEEAFGYQTFDSGGDIKIHQTYDIGIHARV
jgi:hypothetical protein